LSLNTVKKKKAFRYSLSSYKKYICLIGYIGGQKSTSSRVPVHASAGVLPLALQALLVTLEPLTDRVVFKLQAFS
jgi:hypothetical protein